MLSINLNISKSIKIISETYWQLIDESQDWVENNLILSIIIAGVVYCCLCIGIGCCCVYCRNEKRKKETRAEIKRELELLEQKRMKQQSGQRKSKKKKTKKKK